MDNYLNTTSIIAKKGINGGCEFIKYNLIKKLYYTGNTASTAIDYNNSGIRVYGVLNKELKTLKTQLDNLGYTEYNAKWSTSPYKDIKQAGL